jgi:PilZ domain-containing protein
MIGGEGFAEFEAVARNISMGGMLIESPSLPSLGSVIRVSFQMPDSDATLVALAEVKNHYVFNYHEGGGLRWARGVGVRFVEFLTDVDLGEALRATRMRTLH